jgi:hypothetical protein
MVGGDPARSAARLMANRRGELSSTASLLQVAQQPGKLARGIGPAPPTACRGQRLPGGRGTAVHPARPRPRGFQLLPGLFFLALTGMVISYLALIELGKHWFYRSYRAAATPAPRHRTPGHRVRRRAARFTTHHRLPPRPLRPGL